MHIFKWQLLSLTLVIRDSEALVSPLLSEGVESHENLEHGEIWCRTLSVPDSASRVHVEASVVGLTGNPNIFGGWDQKKMLMDVQSNLAPSNAGGYHILSETTDVPMDATLYYVCVTTFSTQGSDFLLTATIWNSLNWFGPQVNLLNSYPVVWRLDDDDVDYVDFRLPISSSDRSLTVSVTPLSGEVDIKITDCNSPQVFGISASIGPDVVNSPIPAGLESVCIRAHGRNSEFALVATTDENNGPFVAQSIPVSGHLPGKFRAYFNSATDILVQANDETFKIFADIDPITDGGVWQNSGLLEIPKSSLEKFQDKNVLYMKIHSPLDSDDVTPSSLFTVSVTTFGTVEQLEDGKPTHVVVDTPNRFRDFRVWVPKPISGGQGVILTIQGDSSEDGSGLGIFASTIRTSHDPRGYMWNTMTGTNDLILTTDESIALSRGIPLIENCWQTGCYVYLSVKSCAVHQGLCREGDAVSKFVLTASLDSSPIILDEGRSSRSIFRNLKKVAIHVAQEHTDKKNLLVYMLSKGTDVTLTRSGDGGGMETKCIANSRCVVRFDHTGETEQINLEISSDDPEKIADIEIGFRFEDGNMLLKNHHPVGGRFTSETSLIDRYRFVVPKEADNGMVEFKGPEGVVATICENEDCVSMSSSGSERSIYHLKKSNSGETVHIKVVSDSDTSEAYSLVPSFFSIFNSLRVGYIPVSVSVEPESKMSWQIGYLESSEWLVTVKMDNRDNVDICIDDSFGGASSVPRCCDSTNPCILQGFGRQVVWIDNKSGEKIFATLQTEDLVVLQNQQWITVADRKSHVFRLTSSSDVSRVDIDPNGSVEYLLGSPNDALASLVVSAYPENFKGTVFVRLPDGVRRARQIVRTMLHANHWEDNALWSYANNVDGNFFVRVESCGDDRDLIVNGNNNIDKKSGYLDLNGQEEMEDISVEGSGRFRVGLVSGEKIGFDIMLSAIIDPLVEDESNGYIYFTAPSNADKTTYRALCLANSVAPTQCTIEYSPNTVSGTSVSCSPETYCQVPLPDGCDGYVTVVSDQGTGFGAFTPVPVHALLGEDLIETSPPSSGFLGFFGWTIRKLLEVVAMYLLVSWIYTNRFILRIAVMRLIDLARGKKKRGDYLLEEEMSNIESGGYKAFGESGSSLNHRSPPPLLIRADNHEMYRLVHNSSNRVYHGA